ncbi:MAG: arylesterase [Gammaproteobacteria bacterium]|nr:MAG: arylesterase [Gammaproteobacteria bacterium]RTZ77448.1 MAG: arylesterase [Gammaproteobacteria bacterium]
MVKKTFLLLFLLLWAGSSHAAGPVILVVGDSISAAHGMAAGEGWVSLLERRLEEASLPYRVVNASISGDTTANVRRRLPALLERHRPAILVLELGGNDGLRGLSLQRMEENLAAMIEVAREGGAQVLLLGIQLPPNYGRRYTEAFAQVYLDLASRFDIPLLPSVVAGIGDNARLMQADGIHPTAQAQPLILELVWKQLRPLLSASRDAAQRAAQ